MGTVLSIFPAVLSSVSPSQSTSVWPSTSKSNDPVNYAKYYILKKNGNVPLQTRIKIADLFCDYVFELC